MLAPIFCCSDCIIVFVQPLIDPEGNVICPNCKGAKFDQLEREDIWFQYTAIYAGEWDMVERFILRDFAETHMGPFNPITNEM